MIDERNGLQWLYPDRTPGSLAWCRQLRVRAMEAMLRRAKKANLSPTEVTQMVKLRQKLTGAVRLRKRIRWEDPNRWTPGTEPKLPSLAA